MLFPVSNSILLTFKRNKTADKLQQFPILFVFRSTAAIARARRETKQTLSLNSRVKFTVRDHVPITSTSNESAVFGSLLCAVITHIYVRPTFASFKKNWCLRRRRSWILLLKVCCSPASKRTIKGQEKRFKVAVGFNFMAGKIAMNENCFPLAAVFCLFDRKDISPSSSRGSFSFRAKVCFAIRGNSSPLVRSEREGNPMSALK